MHKLLTKLSQLISFLDAMKGDREKCLEAGMNKYISKPFRLEEIDEVLRTYTLVV